MLLTLKLKYTELNIEQSGMSASSGFNPIVSVALISNNIQKERHLSPAYFLSIRSAWLPILSHLDDIRRSPANIQKSKRQTSPGPKHGVWGMMPSYYKDLRKAELPSRHHPGRQVITTTHQQQQRLKMLNSYYVIRAGGTRISTCCCCEEDDSPILTEEQCIWFIRVRIDDVNNQRCFIIDNLSTIEKKQGWKWKQELFLFETKLNLFLSHQINTILECLQ